MAFVVKDRVKQSTTTTGTGSIVLNGTVSGFQTFTNALSDGDTTYYAIFEVSTNEWEVGVGTWTESTTTLARTTVLASSNSNSAIDLSAQAEVFITQPAGKAAFFDPSGDLTLVQDPTSNLQAATKQYVDTIAAAGLHYHDPVRVEQEGNLSATYSNGTAGVGATLTNNSTQAALTIDGVALSLNDRVLIYEQTNGYENGIYTVTNVGSASTNWVLTRATDADSYAPSDPDSLGQGDAFFVLEGTAGAGELYVMNTEGTITFGTTNITFTQVAATAVYSAGTGLTLTGTEFSADGANITNVDAVTLDGIDSSQFLRSDTVDTKTAGNLNFSDNVKAVFGDGSDLEIYHSGAASIIHDNGTGNLELRAGSFRLKNGANTAFLMKADVGGAASLFYNGSEKFATTSTGIDVTGRITTDAITEDTSGNVGIGRSAPSHPLHIGDTSGNTILELQRTNTNTSGTVGAISFTASDDHSVAAIHASGDGDNEGAHLIFRTTSAASQNNYFNSTSERMRITSAGLVGIGTSSPAGTLHLHSADTALRLTSSAGSNTPLAQLQYSGSGGYFLRLGDSANNEDVMIRTYGNSHFNGGNVGIGTSNPIADLSIVDSSTGTGIEIQPELTTDTNRITNFDRVESAYKKFRLDASEQQFYISGTERMRIDNSALIVGATTGSGQYNGTGSNGMAVNNAGQAGQYVTIQNETDSNIYLTKKSGWTDNRFIQFSTNATSNAQIVYDSSLGVLFKTGTNYRTSFGTAGFWDDASNGNNVGVRLGGAHMYLSDGAGGVTNKTRDIGRYDRRIRTLYTGSTLDVEHDADNSGVKTTLKALHTSNNTIEIHQFGQSHANAPAVNQIGVSNAEQHLHFVTDDSATVDAGTSTKGIFLRSGGNVGIGTQSPTNVLHIYNSTARVKIENPNADEAHIELKNASGSVFIGAAGAANEMLVGSAAGDMVLGNRMGGKILISADSGYTQHHITITEPGNVGIGTTSPAGKLHVDGMSIFETNMSSQDDWANSPISIYQRDGHSTNDSRYAPNLNFHWTGVMSRSLWMAYDGTLYYGEYDASGNPTTDKIWHSGNDGSGSGLDADTVDGVQASGFVRGDATNQSAITIRADNTDFVVQDLGDSVTNFIWRDHSANVLYLGTANAVITARSTINANSNNITNVNTLSATTKSFVIDHPTKEGMKLRYGSLEGPEDGVYVRGRLTGETVIELPDYWTGLVHEDSITVQLTAMGGKANLWVESITDNKVTVGCDTEIDCFYFVQATRKDVDAWDVEYVADS